MDMIKVVYIHADQADRSGGSGMDDPEDDEDGRFFGGGLNAEQNVRRASYTPPTSS